MVTDAYIDKLIEEWAGKPDTSNKLRGAFRHSLSLSEPDIQYYMRNAKKFVDSKQKYEEAHKRGDWTARSIAYQNMENVRKKFRELVNTTKQSINE